MSYTNVLIQVLATGSSFNKNYLFVGPEQDSLALVVPTQSQATLFNVPNTVYGFIPGFETIDNRQAAIDVLSDFQPIFFSSTSQLANEGIPQTIGCNTFTQNGGSVKKYVGCTTPTNDSLSYGSFAICDTRIGYAHDALALYDPDDYPNGPPGCTPATLKVVSPSSS